MFEKKLGFFLWGHKIASFVLTPIARASVGVFSPQRGR
jgi:hypothetical protein